MKTIKNYNFLVVHFLLLFLLSFNACSQDSQSDWDLILIREDQVKPSMVEDYERALSELKNLLEEGTVKDIGYFSHLRDDYLFTHAVPINQLGEIDKGMLEYVAQKADRDELNLILGNLNSTIANYRNYIVQYLPELSYVPGADNWNEGQPYRRWNFYHFLPGSEKKVEMILKSWKGLYKNHEIKNGFRVFKGFIGVEQPLYILTTWAEDPLDYQQNLSENMEKFSLDGGVLWAEMTKYVKEVKTIEGWYLPQYSFTSGLILAE